MSNTVSNLELQTNNCWKAGRKTQTHELKIHLALKINNRGRSTHTNKINVIRTHQKIQPNNYNTIFFVKHMHAQNCCKQYKRHRYDNLNQIVCWIFIFDNTVNESNKIMKGFVPPTSYLYMHNCMRIFQNFCS